MQCTALPGFATKPALPATNPPDPGMDRNGPPAGAHHTTGPATDRFDGAANDNGHPLAWAPVVVLRGVPAHVPVEVPVEGTFASADGMNIINTK